MKVTLGSLAPAGSRLSSRPDLARGDQMEWSDSRVQIFPDGSFAVDSGVSAFRFRVRGKRWGRWAPVEIR